MKTFFCLLGFILSTKLSLAGSLLHTTPIALTNPFKETLCDNSFKTCKYISKRTTIKMHFDNTESSKSHLFFMRNAMLQKERPQKILHLIRESNSKERHWFTFGGMVVGGTTGYLIGSDTFNKKVDPELISPKGVGILVGIEGLIIGGIVGFIIDEVLIN